MGGFLKPTTQQLQGLYIIRDKKRILLDGVCKSETFFWFPRAGVNAIKLRNISWNPNLQIWTIISWNPNLQIWRIISWSPNLQIWII